MKTKNNWQKKLLAGTMTLAFVFGGAGAVSTLTGNVVAETASIVEPIEDSSPAIYVAEKNANSVVGIITNTQNWTRSNGVQQTAVAQGSGVVIREGGYVLTNYHVIEDGDMYQVLMPSGEKIEASIVATDSATDLAVLKVTSNENDLIPAAIGTVEGLKVGSTAIAIGNPGGEVLANTVTQGIISALERTSVNSGNTTRQIEYIQHDASINSGNSGGGLFNYKGELIGINTLKYSGSSYSSVSFEGLGFAIPVDTAMKIANQLIDQGKVMRPALGVTVTDYSGPDEPLTSNPPQSVCLVTIEEGSAAEKAGLKQYDFLYAVDGERVTSRLQLTSILDAHEVGDKVSVTVVRYNNVNLMQNNNYGNQMYGYGNFYDFFGGYGYGYGNNNNNSNGYNNAGGDGSLQVGGGFEFITVDLTLQSLE